MEFIQKINTITTTSRNTYKNIPWYLVTNAEIYQATKQICRNKTESRG